MGRVMAASSSIRGERIATFRKYLSSDRAGFHLLLVLLFATPVSQAVLNLALAALVLWWLSTGNPVRDLRASPLYVKCFLLFSVVPVVAIFTSDLTSMGELVSEVHGAIKIGIVSLPVYALAKARGGGTQSTIRIVGALVAGGVLASVVGLVSWVSWDPATLPHPKFLNLGGPNHTALYMVPVMVGAIVLSWTGRTVLVVCGWVALLVLLSVSLPLRSFSGFAVMALVGIFCLCVLFVEKRYGTIVLMVFCLSAIGLGTVTIPGADRPWTLMKQEIDEKLHGGDAMSGRAGIFRAAIETYESHLWFGVGFHQFKRATSPERVREELERRGRDYDREKHKFVHHVRGHNLWVHTLVERGLAGLVLVTLFFALSGARVFGLAARILSRRQSVGAVPTQLALLAAAVWTTAFVGGIANTTLHDENGLISVVLLIWCLASLDEPVPENRTDGPA